MIARRAPVLDRPTVHEAQPATPWRARLTSLWPLLLPLPTVALAGWVIIAWKFNGLYGQDPYAYYDYAVGPLRHSVLDAAPLTAMFWPLGYPILVTLSSLALGPVTTAGQMVNLVAVAAAVYLTYLLGRDALLQAGADPRLARRAGLFGALLLGMTGRLLESTVLIMADGVALASALLSAWALVRWSVNQEKSRSGAAWLALSATALAWSVVTRWGQVMLAIAWLAAVIPTVRARRSALWRALPWAAIPAATVLIAQFWLVFTVRTEADLGPLPFAGDLTLVNGTGSGWSFLHLVQHSFVTADGVQRYSLPNGLYYATAVFRPQFLTWLFLPAVAVGLVCAARAYRRPLLLLVSWPAVLLLVDAGLAEQNPRFVLAVLPPIAILAGLGLSFVWQWLRPRWRPLAAAFLAAGLLLIALNAVRELAALNRERTGDLQVAAWTAAHVPNGATTVSLGITLTLSHTTNLRVLDLSVLSERTLQRMLAHGRPIYLLVPARAVNGQFAARVPGINYRFLRDNSNLLRLGTLRGYELSRVGCCKR